MGCGLFRSSPALFNQGAPLAKLLFFAVLSASLIFADTKLHSTDRIRAVGRVILNPIHNLFGKPGKIIDSTTEALSSRSSMQKQLAEQSTLIENLSLLANQAENLQAENSNLRKLLHLGQQLKYKSLTAEIIFNPPNSSSQRLVINRGQQNGLLVGMPVANNLGIMGQVIRVYDSSAEVALLEERDASIPVLVERNGLRGALFGMGRSEPLELRYISNLGDLDVGDYLTTSGIDGTYPPGFPVAIITKIERSSDNSGSIVACRPLADLNRFTHLMVLLYQPSASIPTPTLLNSNKKSTNKKADQ